VISSKLLGLAARQAPTPSGCRISFDSQVQFNSNRKLYHARPDDLLSGAMVWPPVRQMNQSRRCGKSAFIVTPVKAIGQISTHGRLHGIGGEGGIVTAALPPGVST